MMDDFDSMAEGFVTEEFKKLTKTVQSMGVEDRLRYAGKFPPAIWMNAGMTEQTANLISMN